MSLIAMAVFDTEENQRSKYTRVTLECLEHTVTDHRIIIVDNDSCEETKELLKACPFEVITNTENVGTAKAINQAWAKREPKQHLIKMDNDVDINYLNWVDEMEEAIERDPLIGILGLKRKDLMENPFRNDMYKSELRMLPHYKGQRWIIVEDVAHVIETFDRAKTVREAKLVYATLSESFTAAKGSTNNKATATKKSVMEGFASKATAKTKSVLTEGNDQANRFKKLAGII